MTIYGIIMLILTVVFGGISLYLKTKTNLLDLAKDKIAEAENQYKDTTNAGGMKFTWVVDTLYRNLPAPLRIIFTKDTIGVLVQRTFDGIEAYTAVKIDEIVNKIDSEKEKE